MKTSALLILLALSVAAILTVPVNGYVLHNYKWPSAEMTFYVDIPGGDGLWNRAFEEAMNRWNRATIFNFKIRHTREDPCDSPDGVNGVGFASDSCGDSFGKSLAITLNWSRGAIQTESNIIFNSEYSWNVYDGPETDDPRDFRRVAVHELGHALGLGHEENARSIMHPTGFPGNIIIGPQTDDIAGVAALYRDVSPPERPRPPNDNFPGVTRIDDNLESGRVTGSNVNASTESEETGLGSKSVWWGWKSPATGRLTVDTMRSDFDTTLGVYTGAWPLIGTLRLVAENDDTNGQQSRVEVDANEEEIYFFRVAGYNGDSGNIVLNWNLEVPPQITRRDKYIFPQFAFGGGWESTLMVQSFGNGADCTFSAQDRFLTIREHFGNLISGTSMRMPLGAYHWAILKTETPPGMAASSGMAILDCDEEVSANTLFSLRVEGSLVARAVVEPAEEIRPGGFAQLLADHRDGSRFGVAVANLSSQPITVDVRVTDVNGQEIYTLPVNVPANAAQAFFVDELATIPADHVGWVLIGATGSMYVQGLLVSEGGVITTIPATVLLSYQPQEHLIPWGSIVN